MSKRKPRFRDYPLAECEAAVKDLIAEGGTVFMKWTCGGCGQRLTSTTPNVLFEKATCGDCGHVTDITKTGCNYSVMMTL